MQPPRAKKVMHRNQHKAPNLPMFHRPLLHHHLYNHQHCLLFTLQIVCFLNHNLMHLLPRFLLLHHPQHLTHHLTGRGCWILRLKLLPSLTFLPLLH